MLKQVFKVDENSMDVLLNSLRNNVFRNLSEISSTEIDSIESFILGGVEV